MYKLFHNPRCKHSRLGLDHLKQKTFDFQIREYLKKSISEDEIKEILAKSGLEASELVRTQEDYFKQNLKGKSFSNDQWIKILIENPKLIKRPIIVGKDSAVIGSTPEVINKLF
jgi:arsenate reductase (glutaredoxin)